MVTPSYNQAAFIEETIQSVLSQGYENLEYLVLDGGSQDGSREIIARYADHLDHWRSEPDDGQAAAIREGFASASGEILAWLNSDDVLAPGALHRVAEAWDDAGRDVIVVGGCLLFGEMGSGRVHHPSFQTSFNQPQRMPVPEIFDMLRHWFPGEYFYQPEVFFPRSVYEDVGGVDQSLYYVMDFDLWARFALAGTEVVVVPETLAHYREHGAQKTDDRQALYREMVETANRYLDAADIHPSRRRAIKLTNRAALRKGVREGWKWMLHARRSVRDVIGGD